MATDMTKGPMISQITRFTIPLVLGNLFQLTYNAADSVIVGKFVGDDALAAVGTAGPIMNMVILFITGMCMGAGILMSTHYGAKDYGLLERQISTSMLGGLGFSAVISVLLIVFAHPLLELLQVPENIIGDAKGYLRIIFLGLIFTFIYNFFSNTLRALGDSKVPLYFLMISALLNVIGDLFFVVILGWGVLGSAAATVLSEMLCCLFCLIYIRKKVPLLCLGKKWKAFDGSILWKTFNYGITSALQQMCVQLGKICVQTVVNVQGVAFIAAFTAINRVDDFAMTPQQNIAHATTTFMAQNRGAGNIRRMKQGFLSSVLIQLVYIKTLGDWRTHNGVDYACTQGAAVAAPVEGKVVSAGAEGNWGTVVVLEDAAGRSWRLCGVADPDVKAGDTVTAGQKLGTVGTVGCECAEESHIHVEVKQGESYLDPAKLPE